MIQVFPLYEMENWNWLKSISPHSECEIVLHPCALSPIGKLGKGDVWVITKEAQRKGYKVTLAWDCLPTNSDFANQLADFEDLQPYIFNAIRVCDYGVLKYVAPSYPTQLILKSGHHNLRSVQTLVEKYESNLRRLVFSNEVPIKRLEEWNQTLPLEKELLVLGSLNLFHSPRRLLSAGLHLEDSRPETSEFLTGTGYSEEDRRHFQFTETPLGTTMFLDKLLFLMDDMDRLVSAGFTHLRVNFHAVAVECNQDLLGKVLHEPFNRELVQQLRQSFRVPLTRGFSRANKTDRQFDKLSNAAMKRHQPHSIGTILESAKNRYLVIEPKVELETNRHYCFKTPDKREVVKPFAWFRKPFDKPCDRTSSSGIWIASPIPGLCSGTLILDHPP
ncbi:MAG: hypothetical protein CSA81_08295 [Acidobacteria bacterium]|nr:MAG: hypothetical protein CSA81_08295 [Acidobacteriota bacterium]PIE89724.1 MAG: hypothetical protein CR997_09830 [Acidobacteriota bacterium]